MEAYYRQFTPQELAQVMWDPYVAATQAWVPGADAKIVFDKFHVLRIVNEAVDKVRRQSAEGRRRRTAEGHQAPLVGE